MTQPRLDRQHPLPHIRDPALRQRVFTHKSVAGRPSGLVHNEQPGDDNESLAFLGDSVINLIVTTALREALPLSRPGDLAIKRALLVNQDRLAGWADTYGLPERLRAHYATELQVRHNVSTKVRVFQAYVGALFEQSENNFGEVDEWLGPVVGRGLDEIFAMERAADELPDLFSAASIGNSGGLSRGSSSSNQSRSSNGGSSTSQRSTNTMPATPVQMGALALFNQKCQQDKVVASWDCTQAGEAHAPKFIVAIRLPPSGVPIGEGFGTTKSEAKTRAAEQALRTMRWT